MMETILILLWLAVLSSQDIRYRCVSAWMLLGSGILAALTAAYHLITEERSAASLCFGAMIGVAFLLLASATKMAGWADGIVIALLGSVVGFRQCLMTVFFSLLLMSVAALILLVFHKAERGTKLPYIPFLTVGCLLYRIMGG